MKYTNARIHDPKLDDGSATPKQREFLRDHCKFTDQGLSEVSFRMAHRLIQQKINDWKRPTKWSRLRAREIGHKGQGR